MRPRPNSLTADEIGRAARQAVGQARANRAAMMGPVGMAPIHHPPVPNGTWRSPARRAGLISTGYLVVESQASAVANDKGLFAYERTSGVAFTTTVRTEDGTGSGRAGASDNDFRRIDPRALGERAIEKAQLIGGALNARNADEGRSFFSKAGGGNKICEKVADERMTLVSDPLDRCVPTTTFGNDGTPHRRETWIEDGVVKTSPTTAAGRSAPATSHPARAAPSRCPAAILRSRS